MEREDVQPAWEKIVKIGFSNYEKLSLEQRIWFNVEPLITDGLWDHYVNSGADRNTDTIHDLEFLNFASIATLLKNFNMKYFPNGVPFGPDERERQLKRYSDEELERDIEEMDDKFWELCEDLEVELLKHIFRTGIGKV